MTDRNDQRVNASYPQAQVNASPDKVPMREMKSDPSLGELFVGLSEELSTLVRKEMELVQIEMGEKITQTTNGLVRIVIGGVLLLLGAGVLLVAAVVALGTQIPYWLAALMIGVLVVLIGLILVQSGRSSLSTVNLIPKKSLASLQKDTELIKERVQL